VAGGKFSRKVKGSAAVFQLCVCVQAAPLGLWIQEVLFDAFCLFPFSPSSIAACSRQARVSPGDEWLSPLAWQVRGTAGRDEGGWVVGGEESKGGGVSRCRVAG